MRVRLEADSTGMTLVELLVASLCGAIILGLGGAMMFAAFGSQRRIDDSADISRTTTVIQGSLNAGIRNALPTVSVMTVNSTDQIVRAKTLLASATTQSWRCQAWYWKSSNDTLYTTTSTSAYIATPSATSTFAGWRVLSTDVAPLSGSVIFSGGSTQLGIAFKKLSGTVATGSFTNQIVPQPVPTPTASPAASLTCTP